MGCHCLLLVTLLFTFYNFILLFSFYSCMYLILFSVIFSTPCMHCVCDTCVCVLCVHTCACVVYRESIWVLLLGTSQIFFVAEFLICHKHHMYPRKVWIINFVDSKTVPIFIRLKLMIMNESHCRV